MCPRCGEPCSSAHMMADHQTYIPDSKYILEQCKLLSIAGRELRLSRKEILRNIIEVIEPFNPFEPAG